MNQSCIQRARKNVPSRENSKGPEVGKDLVHSRCHQKVLGPKCHKQEEVARCEVAEEAGPQA
jgi:hypothetical protein